MGFFISVLIIILDLVPISDILWVHFSLPPTTPYSIESLIDIDSRNKIIDHQITF